MTPLMQRINPRAWAPLWALMLALTACSDNQTDQGQLPDNNDPANNAQNNDSGTNDPANNDPPPNNAPENNDPGNNDVNNQPPPGDVLSVTFASPGQSEVTVALSDAGQGTFEGLSAELGAGLWSWKAHVEGSDGVTVSLGRGQGLRRVGFSPRQLAAGGDDAFLLVPGALSVRVRVENLTDNAASVGLEAVVASSPGPGDFDTAPWVGGDVVAVNAAVAAVDAADSDDARRQAWVDVRGELMRRGGLPVGRGRQRLFAFYDVVPGSPEESGPFGVGGSWQGWDPGALVMERIEGTRWHFALVEIPQGDRHQYKLVYLPGESWFEDPHNPHAVWDGFNMNTVGNFNSEVFLASPEGSEGRMVHLRGFVSPQLGNARDIFVSLPAAYDEGAQNLGVMVFHDGNESLTRADFARVMDQWSRSPQGQPLIGVYVPLASQDERFGEYTFAEEGARGDLYRAFLVETLVPFIKANFPGASGDPARWGLLGASLGGLISYYVGYHHSDVFGRVGGMSSSFFWADNEIMRLYGQHPGLPLLKCYLDSGSPNDNFEVTRQMRDVLEGRGYDVTYVLDEGGTHDWSFWQARLPGALDALWAD